jgi:hypothetical protein
MGFYSDFMRFFGIYSLAIWRDVADNEDIVFIWQILQ